MLRQALVQWQARVLHVTEGVSARGIYLIEQHALGHGLQLADALIAATALEAGMTLVTGNDRHYRCVDGLEVEAFRPR